jgi:hypothetical protein
MLILVDSSSSHSFVSKSFMCQAGVKATDASPVQARVENGEILRSDTQVQNMEWWTQGYTFHSDMRVLELAAYDAILWYDWLKQHSPMVCHWEMKTLEFQEGSR